LRYCGQSFDDGSLMTLLSNKDARKINANQRWLSYGALIEHHPTFLNDLIESLEAPSFGLDSCALMSALLSWAKQHACVDAALLYASDGESLPIMVDDAPCLAFALGEKVFGAVPVHANGKPLPIAQWLEAGEDGFDEYLDGQKEWGKRIRNSEQHWLRTNPLAPIFVLHLAMPETGKEDTSKSVVTRWEASEDVLSVNHDEREALLENKSHAFGYLPEWVREGKNTPAKIKASVKEASLEVALYSPSVRLVAEREKHLMDSHTDSANGHNGAIRL
jgi:hypothetical protein